MFYAYHVPTSLSMHMPLGDCSGIVDFPTPITLQGLSSRIYLLILIYQACACDDISIIRTIPPYIRSFVNSHLHSHHGHFIDFRTIDYDIHLWTGFPKISLKGSSHATSPSFRHFYAYPYPCLSEYQRKPFRALPRHSTF
jgi:hypothetical protein